MNTVIITSEHGGNLVPDEFKYIFEGHENVLNTHRGIDIGSKIIFEGFSKIADYSKINELTRLLIEINRSPHHPKLFSEFSKNLNQEQKAFLIGKIYLPYREQIEKTISEYLKKDHDIVHISVHTFTPILGSEIRNADIGLLYDPARENESIFCKIWQKNLKKCFTEFKVRLNYPYLGKSDGFITYLRKKYLNNYLGIELEVNQKHLHGIKEITPGLVKTFQEALQNKK